MNYNSKFSRFFTRLMELILLNFVFILTCIPIITIGAAITSMYATCLKMIRNEEGYVIRGYFKDFAFNFKQSTILWLIEVLLYFLLYVVYTAALINGGILSQIYAVLIWVLVILYFFLFVFLYAIIATFQNSLKGSLITAISMMIAHFPMALLILLITGIPTFITLGISSVVLQKTALFWILIGFAAIIFWSSHFFQKIFCNYMEDSSFLSK